MAHRRDVTSELLDMGCKASLVNAAASVTGTDGPPSVGEMLSMSLSANAVENAVDAYVSIPLVYRSRLFLQFHAALLASIP